MLYFSTPYTFNQKLLDAYDHEFMRLPKPDDWLAVMDGDVAFLRSDFGLQIQEYIKKYPETGMFTCYASRSHYAYMIPKDGNDKSTDILFHKKVADEHADKLHLQVKPITQNVTGHLMVISKKTWIKIRASVFDRAKNERIEAIDTAITKGIFKIKMPINLMRGIYVFHYCRHAEGYAHRAHLGYNNFINIITPCSRPENLSVISKSINIPKVAYRWIVVIDGRPEDCSATFPKNAEIYFHKKEGSISGNAQRNYALNLIDKQEKPRGLRSYVYFLDDDTLLHPDLYSAIQYIDNDFIHFNQQTIDGKHRVGGIVKVNQVDSGNVLVSRLLIGDSRWINRIYNADGVFLEEVFKRARNPLYLNQTLSIYNAITK